MKKINSKGFAVIEALIVLIIVVLVSVVGWFVYDRQQAKTDTTTPQRNYISASDSADTFSFKYPEGWTIEPYVWEDCCHGPAKTEPDWSKQSKPITLHPAGAEEITVILSMDKYGDFWESFEALRASVEEDFFAKILFEGKRDDGHEALFSRVDYLGPPDAKVESFTDHRYYFDSGNSVLRVEFREKYHHEWPDDETGPDIDNTRYLADFEHIAQSVKFSK